MKNLDIETTETLEEFLVQWEQHAQVFNALIQDLLQYEEHLNMLSAEVTRTFRLNNMELLAPTHLRKKLERIRQGK